VIIKARQREIKKVREKEEGWKVWKRRFKSERKVKEGASYDTKEKKNKRYYQSKLHVLKRARHSRKFLYRFTNLL